MNTLKTNDFSLSDTLDCGQSFCWVREGKGYINADLGQALYIEQNENELVYETSAGLPVDITNLLGLDHPIEKIKKELSTDEFMIESIAFAPGLRVVQDPFFACLISFICSIWKNIPAISLSMDRIRRKWGPTYLFREKVYYGMPSPEVLASATLEEIRGLGLGFRAGYIKKTAEMIASQSIDVNTFRRMSYEETRAELKSLHGVGNKVADCVCLFSLGFLESFPIDVWIERVIRDHYAIFRKSGNTYAKKSEAARAYFGRYAGYAQEYLYHYVRHRSHSSCSF